MSVLFFGRLSNKFAVKFVKDQFLAWQKAQEALGRSHPDKRTPLEELGAPMKLAIAQGFAPAVCQLLGELGLEGLVAFSQAGIDNDRERLEEQIEEFAAQYHDYWTTGREVARAIGAGDEPGFKWLAKRTDDVPWAELPNEEQDVIREIVWQWSLMLAGWGEGDFVCFTDRLFGES